MNISIQNGTCPVCMVVDFNKHIWNHQPVISQLYSTHHKRIQLVHLQVFVERQPSIGKWIEPLINETFELPFSLVKSCKIRSFVGNHIGKWYKLVIFPQFFPPFFGMIFPTDHGPNGKVHPGPLRNAPALRCCHQSHPSVFDHPQCTWAGNQTAWGFRQNYGI